MASLQKAGAVRLDIETHYLSVDTEPSSLTLSATLGDLWQPKARGAKGLGGSLEWQIAEVLTSGDFAEEVCCASEPIE